MAVNRRCFIKNILVSSAGLALFTVPLNKNRTVAGLKKRRMFTGQIVPLNMSRILKQAVWRG
jgi:hypothetical protein